MFFAVCVIPGKGLLFYISSNFVVGIVDSGKVPEFEDFQHQKFLRKKLCQIDFLTSYDTWPET